MESGKSKRKLGLSLSGKAIIVYLFSGHFTKEILFLATTYVGATREHARRNPDPRWFVAGGKEICSALKSLARGYEADREKRRDLLQDIHVPVWRSFANFNGACSKRTWVFRIAHTAISHVVGERRKNPPVVLGLEESALEFASP